VGRCGAGRAGDGDARAEFTRPPRRQAAGPFLRYPHWNPAGSAHLARQAAAGPGQCANDTAERLSRSCHRSGPGKLAGTIPGMTDAHARHPLQLSGPPDGAAPLELGHRVTLYVCGITPYDAAHLGHAFTYAAFDTLVRFLRERGHEVVYCQNVTDVDDDVLRRAARNGEDYLELGRRETAAYLHDMDALNIARPTWFPRATQEIGAMVEMATELEAAGSLYEVDGTLFFDVSTFPSFGSLSGLDEETQRKLLAERGGDPEDPRKRHPLDFVVWQPSAPGEPWWDSPWGHGRPGWHLECSAMSRRYLGITIDLHGGGADLLYPHHESERAQSETVNRARFVRRWLHTGMVRHQNEKMSKSLGNLVFVRDLAREHEPAAVRLALLAHHYAATWSYEPDELKEAAARLEAWRRAARGAGLGSPLPEPVDAALANDLDTPTALVAVDALATERDGAAVRAAAAVLGVVLEPAASR
jgi:L-cysteine:1D-myo-inositol 2-amino-2-deoxy-alpha-D-glucopyranoside ligase